MSTPLPDRQRNLQDQLRISRARLAEAQTAVETLRTQCAQLEGALGLCNALLADGTPERATYAPGALFTTDTGEPNA